MKFSVVIPCYNRESSIRDSICSILGQVNNVDLEVIVVDDGSSDNSIDVIKDLNIKILRTGGRTGACNARNLGISHATGDWILFNDSDDYWRADKISKILDIIQSTSFNDIEYITHSFIRGKNSKYCVGGNISNKNQYLYSTTTLSKLLAKNYFSTQCLAIKKTVFDKLEYYFDSSMDRFQDWEFVIRLANVSDGYYINDSLTICIETPNSISTGFDKGIEARKMIYAKHSLLYSEYLSSKLRFKYDLFIRVFIKKLNKFFVR